MTLVTVIGPMLGLVMVIVSVEVPSDWIVLGLKALLIVGAVAVTVRLAVFDTAPVGACVLLTPLVVLGCVPGVLLRTTTVTVQELFAGMVNPVNESAVWLAVSMLLLAPVHVPPAAPAASMNMLLKVSVNAPLVSATPLVLLMVKVMVLVAPKAMLAGPKALVMLGATAVTVRLAVFDTAPIAASLLDTPEVLLGNVPGVLAVTKMVTVQLPDAGMVSPLTLCAPVAPSE